MGRFLFLYIDSSGDPGRYNGENSKHYVMCGVALGTEKWYEAFRNLRKIIEKYLPGLKVIPELKANDIRQGKGVFGALSRDKRAELISEVYDAMVSLNPTIICIVVDKEKYYAKYPDTDPEALKQRVFRYLADRFELYLKKNKDTYGVLVYDYEGKRDKALRDLLNTARTRGVYHRDLQAYWQYERVVETVFFVESETSIGIQLADFAARAVFECYERNACTSFEKIKHLFDKSPSGEIVNYGLKVLP